MSRLQSWFFVLVLIAGVSGCASTGTTSSLKVFDQVAQADRAYEQEQWQEAEQHYLAVIKQVPNDAYAWFRLGNVYMRQERLSNAIAMYQEALQRDPKQAKPYFNMATVHLLQAHQALGEAHKRLPPVQQARVSERMQELETLLYGKAQSLPETVKAPARAPQSAPARIRDPLSSDLTFTMPNSRHSVD